MSASYAEFLGKVQKLKADAIKPAPDEQKPYENQYAARVLMENMLGDIRRAESPTDSAAAQRAELLYAIGMTHFDTEENSEAERKLVEGFRAAGPFVGIPEVMLDVIWNECPASFDFGRISTDVAAHLRAQQDEECVPPLDCSVLLFLELCNALGILWANRDVQGKAHGYFGAAEAVYQTYQAWCTTRTGQTEQAGSCRGGHPEPVVDPLSPQRSIERVYTLTCFYLAQAHGHKGDAQRSGAYVFLTLARQLEYKLEFECCEWVRNALTLTGVLAARARVAEAMHVLLVAVFVLRLKPRSTLTEPEALLAAPANEEEESDRVASTRASIYTAYGKILTAMLSASVEFLTSKGESCSRLVQPSGQAANLHAMDPTAMYCFNVPGIPAPSELAAAFPDITKYSQARVVFCRAIDAFLRAQKYYVFDGFVTSHIDLIHDMHVAHVLFGKWPVRDGAPYNGWLQAVGVALRRSSLYHNVLGHININVYGGYVSQGLYNVGEAVGEVVDMLKSLRTSPIMAQPFVLPGCKEPVGSTCPPFRDIAVSLYDQFVQLFAVEKKEKKDPMQRHVIALPKSIPPYDSAVDPQGEDAVENLRVLVLTQIAAARHVATGPFAQKEDERAAMVLSLRRYEWIISWLKRINKLDWPDFQMEITQVKEMIELLPAKIRLISRTM